MKKGEVLDLQIEKFADRGKSVARADGFTVFVSGAVPGDRIRARVLRKKKDRVETRLLEVLEASTLRTEPVCPYFGTCGGCKWQHVDYAAQIVAKRQQVEEAFSGTGAFTDLDIRPVIGSERVFFYRNKMEFSFSAERWLTAEEIASGKDLDRNFALGLHVPGHYDKVLDLQECYLQSELSVRLVNETRAFARLRGWAPWNMQTHEGYLRHLVIRQGEHTGEVMVNLVTNGFDPARMETFGAFLGDTFPEVTTFVNTIHTGVAQTTVGEAVHTIFGAGVIHDRIGPYEFEIAPNAFFQTNTLQAERLYEVVRTFAELRPDDLVYDLYCGAGTISLYVAGSVRHVVGVEMVEEAVDNARENAAANGVSNCTFVNGDLMRLFTPEFIETYGRPDVLIVDPPRAGMHKKVVEQIGRMRPERFVYVSCNPQTQAQDLSLLRDIYTIEAVQPVDLFPHTPHVENVIKLRAL